MVTNKWIWSGWISKVRIGHSRSMQIAVMARRKALAISPLVLRTPYHMVCRLVNAISVVYYFHHILNLALRSFEWVSAWLSGIIPSGAPPPTPRRSPPRGSRERRALTPLLSPNHRLFALNHLVNLLSRHMLGLTACAIPRQLDDSIPRENYPHESAKGP